MLRISEKSCPVFSAPAVGDEVTRYTQGSYTVHQITSVGPKWVTIKRGEYQLERYHRIDGTGESQTGYSVRILSPEQAAWHARSRAAVEQVEKCADVLGVNIHSNSFSPVALDLAEGLAQTLIAFAKSRGIEVK